MTTTAVVSSEWTQVDTRPAKKKGTKDGNNNKAEPPSKTKTALDPGYYHGDTKGPSLFKRTTVPISNPFGGMKKAPPKPKPVHHKKAQEEKPVDNGGLSVSQFDVGFKRMGLSSMSGMFASQSESKQPKKAAKAEPKVSYKLNLDALTERIEKIQAEIESLEDVDQDKRCLAIAMFLNTQKPMKSPENWEKDSFESHQPLLSLPGKINKMLTKFVSGLSPNNVAASFELVLAELVSKSGKNSNLTLWGYQVILQLLAKTWPREAVLNNHKALARLFGNVARGADVTKAYVVVWSVLQCLKDSPALCMQIWCKVALPHISNKSLARVVCHGLELIMTSSEALLLAPEPTLTHVDYFHLLDYTFTQPDVHNVIDKSTSTVLQDFYPKLKAMACIKANPLNFFTSYVHRYKKHQSAEMKEEILQCVGTCLKVDTKGCYQLWKSVFFKCPVESKQLLLDLTESYAEFQLKKKDLSNFATEVAKEAKREGEEAVQDMTETLENCVGQLSSGGFRKSHNKSKNNRGSSFSFLRVMFYLAVLVAACAYAEYKVQGPQSLTKAGVLVVQKNWSQCYQWAQKTYPNELKLVEKYAQDAYAEIEPRAKDSLNWLSTKSWQCMDYLFKDGPVKFWKYFEKDVWNPVNKYYQKNWDKSVRRFSRDVGLSLDAAIKSVMASVDLEFLRPYLK